MTEQHSVGERSGVEITLDHVTKHYPGQREAAVEDVSIVLPAGRITVFVGPSGCGKTTTMKMINRLIEPTSGTITVGGADVLSMDPDRLRRGIGYAIQQAGLFPHLTVAQNIGMVPGLLGWDRARTADRTAEMLDLVGLDAEFADRFPRQLSGGQQQRVGVARALAADPPVLLMDEPFGAVDPITRGNLQDELLNLQSELGKTIVFVTHDFDEAVKLGDRIAVLGPRSKVLQFDTPEAILANPADDTVAGFVGAGASLKQLTLLRVRDVEIDRTGVVTAGVDDPVPELRGKLAESRTKFALVLDRRNRPVRWVHVRDLNAATSLAGAGKPVGDSVSVQSTLQDALEAILTEGGNAAVTGSRGEYLGTIGLGTVTDAIAALREEHSDNHGDNHGDDHSDNHGDDHTGPRADGEGVTP
ncbi:ABC transporter ATP-binding protein [Actinokineospora spheciospongiae]|uniref:ABC transporter ATP-binding protein n=1 Tax=Actinokineospora spheciospongiae TaxID=909613 RepID=UPI000D952A15|nr:ATP-binding cassette domain-containing protein [Actinokineospora spheciospongiae]PWW58433.1 osmoprotectant transport system ATP-binding protein [Actinokineospora spheciospongiae]